MSVPKREEAKGGRKEGHYFTMCSTAMKVRDLSALDFTAYTVRGVLKLHPDKQEQLQEAPGTVSRNQGLPNYTCERKEEWQSAVEDEPEHHFSCLRCYLIAPYQRISVSYEIEALPSVERVSFHCNS